MVKFSFQTEEVEEGRAQVIVPKAERGEGPGKKEGFPFYNPVMEVNRDISVLVVQKTLSHGSPRVLDGLSGTGIRGVRFALEVEGDLSILLNDWNEMCHELILENIKRNEIGNAHAKQQDLNHLLQGEEFDYVDVDPFGTPIHFLENALKGVKTGGILAVTATDTAALAGSYPMACKRKYDAATLPIPTRHEIGVRILIGHCARTAVNHDLGITPILSHSTDHYYRTYFTVGADPDTTKRNIGYFSRDPSTLENALEEERRDALQVAGPLWIGGLWDARFLSTLRPRSYMSFKTSKTLELIKGESEINIPFHSSDEIASHLRVHTPSVRKIVEMLRENGFDSSPTHFDPKGFRTNAPIEDIKKVFKGL